MVWVMTGNPLKLVIIRKIICNDLILDFKPFVSENGIKMGLFI